MNWHDKCTALSKTKTFFWFKIPKLINSVTRIWEKSPEIPNPKMLKRVDSSDNSNKTLHFTAFMQGGDFWYSQAKKIWVKQWNGGDNCLFQERIIYLLKQTLTLDYEHSSILSSALGKYTSGHLSHSSPFSDHIPQKQNAACLLGFGQASRKTRFFSQNICVSPCKCLNFCFHQK